MHLEAARMLQFSEEEFINALEWNNSVANTTHAVNSGNQRAAGLGSGTSQNTSGTNSSNRRPPPSSNASHATNGSLMNKKKAMSSNDLNLSVNGERQQQQSQVKHPQQTLPPPPFQTQQKLQGSENEK